MSFRERLVQLLPHYLIMLGVMFAVLIIVQELYGQLGFWASFGVAIAVAVVYPFATRRLGVAPEPWQ